MEAMSAEADCFLGITAGTLPADDKAWDWIFCSWLLPLFMP